MQLCLRNNSKCLKVLLRGGAYEGVRKRSIGNLAEVGKWVPAKASGTYDTGQLFFHKIFGYRGVVLFPWNARVYDRGSLGRKVKTSDHKLAPDGREVEGRLDTYYQVLIDSRDTPFIRAQSEAVTFLGNRDGSKAIYVVPGLDYVSHGDIMPYSSRERMAIQHDLFSKFLSYVPGKNPSLVGQDPLKAWQKKNYAFLDNSEVHIETTENVRVTVMPFFMGLREGEPSPQYWWRYCVRLENLGDSSVQVRERLWRLFSLSGTLETVRGRGVVGQEPVLDKSSPAFQYSSHVSLQSPTGHMWGTFRMEREDGYSFDCRIPPFSLESKKRG